MASSNKAMMAGVVAFLLIGAGLANYGYQTYIYPIDRALGNLSAAERAQTPEQLASYVIAAKRDLPQSGNPVWAFPTAKTDFGLIQLDLDNMVSRSNAIASVDPHSSAYSTGMNDMRFALDAMQKDIIEAIPYLYVSTTNMALSAAWVAVLFGIFAAMRRGKARYREQEYESQ